MALAFTLALGAACGMCYLHNCTPPVIHRDLKSANLMVDASFRVKVGDFNLSRVTAANRATGNSVSTSVNLHSPRWSAPEVLDTVTIRKRQTSILLVLYYGKSSLYDCPGQNGRIGKFYMP